MNALFRQRAKRTYEMENMMSWSQTCRRSKGCADHIQSQYSIGQRLLNEIIP